MVVKRKRKAVVGNTPSGNDIDMREDSEPVIAFEAFRAITDIDVNAMIPQASPSTQVVNADYQFPDIPESTMQRLKKIKTEWAPAKEPFLQNAKRASVYVFNETVENYSVSKDQAMHVLDDMMSAIDKKLRLLHFPVTTDKVLDPNMLKEYRKAKIDVEYCIEHYTRSYDDNIPVLEELEKVQEKYDELVTAIERIENEIEENHNYSEPVVDPDDYAQSLLLFNSKTLNLSID